MSRRDRNQKPDDTLFQGYVWPDGKLHPEPAPSTQPFKVAPPSSDLCKIAEPAKPEGSLPFLDPTAPAPVPDAFAFTDRARLRAQALDFALRAAALMHHPVANGAAILKDAEDIERWLANP